VTAGAGAARYALVGDIAVITMDSPPVNKIGSELRQSLVAALGRFESDAGARAAVLVGAGKGFSGGGDLRELGTPAAATEPTLGGVIRAIEAASKPVVAALHGIALGGGLELALACHYRVAAAGTKVALPEVKLGLIPGAGGTQRFPRLVGMDRALDMMIGGATVACEQLRDTALFDAVIDGDLVAGALAFAAGVAGRRPLPRARDLPLPLPAPPATVDALLGAARQRIAAAAPPPGRRAPLCAVDAVAAAVSTPFDEGLAVERRLFVELLAGTESKAMRHLFFAERAAAKIPDVPADTPARPVRTAAVVGAGTMGGGIAMCFANAAIPVTVLDVDQAALDRGLGAIRRNYEGSVKKGKLTPADAERRVALIGSTLRYQDLASADIVVEAVSEDIDLKRAVWRQLDRVMRPGAILATNTSTLNVNTIARFTERPADALGMHFFSPAHVMRLLEIVRGADTALEVLATAMSLARRLGKTAVVAGVCDGFIGNRMLEQYQRQAWFMLEEGALPRQVDNALESWGMAMGPFRMSDLAGNDVGWHIRKRRYVEKPGAKYARVADRVCELGRFGQKTGAGWYRYEKGQRQAIPDPVIDELVVAYSHELGVRRRDITDEEIVQRCLFALANEGARIVEDGIAQRPSDIDVVYAAGYGFPAFRGGPLMYADTVGLPAVVAAMERFAARPHGDPSFWKPAALLARLAAENRTFSGLA
jgi:3-hydroxyacyl-CoA dehydrogenase